MLLSFGKEKLLWYHSLLELVRSNLVSVGACTLTWWNLIKHESSSGGTCWAPFLLLLFLKSVDKYLFLFWYDEENTEFLLLHLSQKVVRGQPCTTWRLLVPKIRRSGCCTFQVFCFYAISNGVSFKLTLLVYMCRKQTPHSLLPPQKRTSSVKLQYKEAVVYAFGYVCVLLPLLWAVMTFLWLSSGNLTNYYKNCRKKLIFISAASQQWVILMLFGCFSTT